MTHSLEQRETLFRKIAKMELMGVSRGDIADVVGLSEGRLAQLVSGDEGFKRVFREESLKEHEKLEALNGGWDVAEHAALTQVIENLGMNPDPEFALKVASVANKARRRGKFNKPIVMPDGAQRTTLVLATGFVAKLEERGGGSVSASTSSSATIMRKDVNYLQPSRVEDLMQLGEDSVDSVDSVANKFNFALVSSGLKIGGEGS